MKATSRSLLGWRNPTLQQLIICTVLLLLVALGGFSCHDDTIHEEKQQQQERVFFLRKYDNHSSSSFITTLLSQLMWTQMKQNKQTSMNDNAMSTSLSTSSSPVTSSFVADKAGVTFDRNITKFPNDGATLSLNFYRNNTTTTTSSISEDSVEDVCTTHDSYGDNACHYNWDDTVLIKYSIESVTQFTSQDTVIGSFLIDDRIEWSFTCKVCGEDCILEVPVIKLDYAFPMPDCPVKPKKRAHSLLYQLWKASPTHGFITTSIKGTVTIIKTATATYPAASDATNDTTESGAIAAGGIDGNNTNKTIAQIDIQVNVR